MYTDISRSRLLYPIALVALLGCGGAERGASIDAAGPFTDGLGSADNDALNDWVSEDPGLSCAKSATARLAPAAGTSQNVECEPSVAARSFSSALCSCEDTNVAGLLKTRSFRSRGASPGVERLGGSVGVNGNYITGGLADVGGSFAVAGSRDVLFGGLLRVGADLRFNPSFDVAGLVGIGRDAHLNGALRAVGVIGVGGDLYRSPDSRMLGLALVNVGGIEHTAPVVVDAPCGCASDEVLDVAARVADARTDNDNASIGLDVHALDLVAGVGTAQTLPTGRYFLHQVAGVGAIQLRISGKVELHVGDDFIAGPLFGVTLDPDAELDLFVRDDVVLAGGAVLGDPSRPSATRIYAGGTGDIAVAGLNAFAGNLYAPSANVLVGGIGKVYGSLFGKNIIAAGILDVGYDESVRDGVECTPVDPPSTEAPPTSNPPSHPPSDPPSDEPPTDGPPRTEPTAPVPPTDDDASDPEHPGSSPGAPPPSPCEPAGDTDPE